MSTEERRPCATFDVAQGHPPESPSGSSPIPRAEIDRLGCASGPEYSP